MFLQEYAEKWLDVDGIPPDLGGPANFSGNGPPDSTAAVR
jgi:hypothetical protein